VLHTSGILASIWGKGDSMVCRFCGLETGAGTGHPTQAECIDALQREVARARQLIDTVRQARADRRERGGARPETAGKSAEAAEQGS